MDISSLTDLDSLIKSAGQHGVVALDFWVDWSEPCKPVNDAFRLLATQHPTVKCAVIHAEKAAVQLVDKFSPASVPCVVFLRGGTEVDRLEGANVPELRIRFEKYAVPVRMASATPVASKVPPEQLKQRLEQLIRSQPVMVFMKGNAAQPRCGFSAQMVELIKSLNVQFGSFDILSDESVRQGLKEYSNWPTYPQLYAGGKLVGGLDIAKELNEQGELKPLLEQAK